MTDLEVRYYGTKPGTYKLYDDDGETFNYEKGAYSWRTITVSIEGGQIRGNISATVTGKPNTIGKVTYKKMTN
ncbi:DUF5110 domain-containing protein [Paraflavitalea speifideaquila]|uniref:DUF5110 domain-containing protein n=1 Tax=Paraflavitalea speifideaquila TaxID=3076558 RepID=UPI0028EF71A8|nr:DUF5110 domain-containing protein [Paraflavitalea speifideiaquila]